MTPPIKDAGTKAWKNPTSLEHTTVFDHKITAKIAEELLNTPADHLRGETEEEIQDPFTDNGKQHKYTSL